LLKTQLLKKFGKFKIFKKSKTRNELEEKKQQIQETKATFVVRYDQLDKLKAISYMERKMIKNVLEEALSLYIQKYERETGEIVLGFVA